LQAADNPKAKTIYDNLVKEMHLFRRRGLSATTNMNRSLDEHRAISAAAIHGDVSAVRATALTHITSGCARYMQMMEQEPDTLA